jgi:hypothetical protein
MIRWLREETGHLGLGELFLWEKDGCRTWDRSWSVLTVLAGLFIGKVEADSRMDRETDVMGEQELNQVRVGVIPLLKLES